MLSPQASIPSVATKGSTGFDICSSTEETIPPGKRRLIPTDLILIPPTATYIRLAHKYGLSWKFGINVLAGVTDPDYRGNIKVLLQTHGKYPFLIHPGDTITQGILEKAMFLKTKKDTEKEVTDRGPKGFRVADEPQDEAPISEPRKIINKEPDISAFLNGMIHS
ncbi:uncharacterized protein [Ambystoma mexicanum]|uniref:uncharacterized protein n=1 Tax=Ambystoma mexicanum TaxID=8296 RepID=UPI0037E9AF9E